MSLEDDLKRQALAAAAHRVDQWQSDLRKALTRHEEVVARSLDTLQRAASLDSGALEPDLASAIAGAIASQGEASPGLERLRDALAAIDRATTLSEAMAALVNESAPYAERVAMFIVKGQAAVGWYGSGVRQEAIDSLSMPLTDGGPLGRAFESRQPLRASSSDGSTRNLALAGLGGEPAAVHIVPIQLRDKVAALLYADSSTEMPPAARDALEILCRYGARVIDLISLQKAARPAAAPPPERLPVDAGHSGEQASRPAVAPVADAVPAVEEAQEPSPVVSLAQTDGASTVAIDWSDVAASTTLAAPAVVLSEADRKVHEQARRFARLVVSEIKLYNESKVTEGRRHGDLYERLKDDIERGRQVYAERVPPSVRDSTNYYVDELVRVLAGGDPGALGPM